MKKNVLPQRVFILLLLIMNSTYVFCQEVNDHQDKLKFKSFSISPIEVSKNSENFEGGFSITSDISYEYKKNIFTFSIATGRELLLNIFGGKSKPDSFRQINLSYGRELHLGKVFSLEPYIGIGYFSFKSINLDPLEKEYKRESGIGVPLALKIKFNTSKNFFIGFRISYNLNSINNIETVGLLFQYNFPSKE